MTPLAVVQMVLRDAALLGATSYDELFDGSSARRAKLSPETWAVLRHKPEPQRRASVFISTADGPKKMGSVRPITNAPFETYDKRGIPQYQWEACDVTGASLGKFWSQKAAIFMLVCATPYFFG